MTSPDANRIRRITPSTRARLSWPDLRQRCSSPPPPPSERLKKGQRLAARAGLETVLHPPRWNIDDVHRPVALAGDEQFVAAERHVHWLTADPDGMLVAE